jgi:hypothetical protein
LRQVDPQVFYLLLARRLARNGRAEADALATEAPGDWGFFMGDKKRPVVIEQLHGVLV